MVGKQHARKQRGRTGAAAHADGNLVAELKMKCRGKDPGDSQNIKVRGEDEVVFEAASICGVAAGGVDAELPRDRGVDREIQRHRNAEGIETRAEVG